MKKKKAFTLIELMGVLTIIGILTVILVPVINNTIKNNKQELYNEQIELIKLSAKNLTGDNPYILPEEDKEEIYITLGQLRAMGYAEETIINPLTKENFSNSMVVMIIKREKDYEYEVELVEGEIETSLGITVSKPSKKYVKRGNQSSYIITAKTTSTVDDKTIDYYINMDENNIALKGQTSTEQIKYKLDGNNGLYKLTLAGGETEGTLYFNFDNLKGLEGNDIDTSEINKELDTNSNKQIIVDNTAPVITYSINETKVWKKSVGTKIEVIDNNGTEALDSDTYKYIYSLSNKKEQELTKIYNLEDEVKQESGDGEYYLISQACDKAENCVQKVSGKYLVDNTVPKCNWGGENATWTKTPVTVTLTGIDNHKMNASKTEYTKTYNESGVEIKTSSLSYEIEDEAGNKTSCEKNVNVYYDTKAPNKPSLVANDGAYTSNSWTNKNVTMKYSSTDGGVGGVYYQYNHNNSSDWKSDNTDNGFVHTKDAWTISWDSVYDYYIRACDALGNCGTSNVITIKIDKTAPTCGTAEGSSTTWTNYNRTIKQYCSDNLSGCTQNPYSTTYYSTTTTTTGSVNIYDNAGNSNTCSYNVYVRNTPTVTISGHINGWVCGSCNSSCITTYRALDDSKNCIKSQDGQYGNTMGKVGYYLSGNTATFNWEIRQGGATYIYNSYWVKFLIKNSSGTVVHEVMLKEAYGDNWSGGSIHTGTVSYTFDTAGTYYIYITGNSDVPSFNMDLGTITVS